ncbi:MAG: hypothetical protein ABFE01_01305, partial [Phycisphaerales bacterium]
MRSTVGACVLVGFLVTTAWCDEAQTGTKPEDKPSAYVGGGAIISSQPYVGTDARVYPVPLFA